MSAPRILVITPKSPSTNPRMRKAADALANNGYEVRVLWAYGTAWASKIDQSICEEAKWASTQIGGNPSTKRLTYFFSRLFRKLFEYLGNGERAQCRSFNHYVQRGVRWKPDLVIGHNPGALGPLVKISQQLQVPALFDAEDFHRGESYIVRANLENRMIQMEDRYFPHLTALTAASPLISKAYRSLYPNKKFTTINNAFPSTLQPPLPVMITGPLKIIWFSQVVGIDRGLQEFMQGMALAFGVPVQLSLVGSCSDENRRILQQCIEHSNHRLEFHEPMPEKQLFEFIGQHEIGLALEVPTPKNRDICRTNKLYTYILSGIYMLASKTAAQVQFIEEYPSAGEIIDINDPDTVAKAIRVAYSNRGEILEKRQKNWELGNVKANWEEESKILIETVQATLQK